MRTLKDKLWRFLEDGVHKETAGLPVEWESRLKEAVPFEQFWSLSLLSCASAQWRGASPEIGIPSAAAVLLTAGATAAHALPVTGVRLPCMGDYHGGGPPEAGRILAGDALLPLAVKVLGEHEASVSLHLTEILLKSAAGILEAMSFGRHGQMTGSWNGRLASLAARMGVIASGSGSAPGETAALAGMALGKASAVLNDSPSRDAMVEAEMMLRDALEPLGPGAPLFHEIAEYTAARGNADSSDLFARLEPS